jgi:RNA polymerase sigma-70 factor (ECF subfamily)
MTATIGYAHDELENLVAAARQGDRGAMDKLCTRFRGMVMSIAIARLGDWHEADDLCQDAFIQAFRKLDQLHADAAFVGWLQTIVVRMAINRGTRRARTTNVEQEFLENTVEDTRGAFDNAVREEEAETVWDKLQGLRALDRDTLVAFYIDGQSLIEMSNRFAAPIGTIKRRLHTARKRLAKKYKVLI